MAARRLQEHLANINTPALVLSKSGKRRIRILVREVNDNNVDEGIPISEEKIHTERHARSGFRPPRRVQHANGKYFMV